MQATDTTGWIEGIVTAPPKTDLDEMMERALARLEKAVGGLLTRIEAERIERHALGAALDDARRGIDLAAEEIRAALAHDGHTPAPALQMTSEPKRD